MIAQDLINSAAANGLNALDDKTTMLLVSQLLSDNASNVSSAPIVAAKNKAANAYSEQGIELMIAQSILNFI